MSKFTITIQKVEKEDFEMELEADTAIAALDAARELAATRNKDPKIRFSITKVEQKDK